LPEISKTVSAPKAADTPNFERYDENFDPLTAMAGSKSGCP
jgi:hypothetical protein